MARPPSPGGEVITVFISGTRARLHGPHKPALWEHAAGSAAPPPPAAGPGAHSGYSDPLETTEKLAAGKGDIYRKQTPKVPERITTGAKPRSKRFRGTGWILPSVTSGSAWYSHFCHLPCWGLSQFTQGRLRWAPSPESLEDAHSGLLTWNQRAPAHRHGVGLLPWERSRNGEDHCDRSVT